MTTIAQIIATATHYGSAKIYRDAGGYYAYVPYYDHQPNGPTTETRHAVRHIVQARIRSSQAGIALALAAKEFGLGGAEWDEDTQMLHHRIADCDPHSYWGVSDWRKEVRAIIRKHRAAAAERADNLRRLHEIMAPAGVPGRRI